MFSSILSVVIAIVGVINLLTTINNCRKRYDDTRRNLERRDNSIVFFRDNFPFANAGRRKRMDKVNWKKEGF